MKEDKLAYDRPIAELLSLSIPQSFLTSFSSAGDGFADGGDLMYDEFGHPIDDFKDIGEGSSNDDWKTTAGA